MALSYNLKKTEDYFTFTNSVDPDEMQHFIWVFTVCQSTCLPV